MNRRGFLLSATGAALTDAAAQPAPIPIIDTHIHLFDPTRPEGVPWPPKTNTIIYKPALPSRYREVTKSPGVAGAGVAGAGVVGAIAVECSPWLEDNQWVLDVAEKDTIMVGMIGNLEAGKPEFRKHLERFHRKPLFRGIRYGYLWGRNLGAELARPEFIADLKALAAAGLTLDTANPGQRTLTDVLRITDLAPALRIVIDHLPAMQPPADAAARATYQATLRELAPRKQVYVKISEILRRSGGRVPLELSFYRERLDEICEAFGADRVLYGSDWPNSDPFGTYAQVLGIAREYFTGRGREASEKYFWRNSAAAYRWVRRDASQPAA
ncbi:MAG: amidohydrolase family protein [Bryobacteraceae bacterium]